MKLSYDGISPFTGNMDVLIEHDDDGNWTKLCMQTGYTTQRWWTLYSEDKDRFESVCPDHIKDTKFEDSFGNVWYKITLTSGDIMLYPDVYDGDSMWFVGKWRKLGDNERTDNRFVQVRKINGKEVPYIFDVETATMFEETAFPDAYDHFNKLVNEQYND